MRRKHLYKVTANVGTGKIRYSVYAHTFKEAETMGQKEYPCAIINVEST